MPKNCKGCVRYKLLTIYQYAQSDLFESLFSCLLAPYEKVRRLVAGRELQKAKLRRHKLGSNRLSVKFD
jgi:hypothetical protein